MKNFRKVLALVLVVATLFSFAAMASAKTLADYKDADKITTENYEVAVEVLTALEILDGYEDDTFKPTNTITRAEMAKMIAVLANAGDADVDKLYAAACTFADVDKVNDWFASYVSYCAYTGIVSGRSADTFDPYGKVTGLETAKMLLVTLGFSADEQGYKGANWKINVLRDAQNFGLLEGFAAGYDIDAAITREEAANMMLNALKAPVVVGVLSENIVKITNALYNTRGISATLIDAEKYGWLKMYGNVIVDDITLGEALYNSRLDVEDYIDCYDRPGTVWTLRNKKGTLVLEGKFVADPIFASATVRMDLVDVLEEEFKLKTYKLNAYVDGIEVLDWNAYDSEADAEALADFAEYYTGKGVLTEVYVDDVADQITIVVVNTKFGYVDITVKASNTFTVDGSCFSNKGYDFEEGDAILYWVCDSDFDNKGVELHDAKIAEPVVATVTRTETKGGDMEESTFKADGEWYEYSFNADCAVMGVPQVDEKYEIYVDEYGYVMDYALYEEATEYFYGYFVEGSGSWERGKTYGDGTYDYTATKDMVDFTAAYNADVAVDEELFWTEFDEVVGALLMYSIDADGRATIEGTPDVWPNAKVTEDGDVVSGNGKIVRAYGNDDTKYLVRTWDYANDEYVYTAYTQDTLPYTFRNVNGVQVFSETVGVKNQTEVATYVFIDALYAEVASHAFVLDYAKSVSDTLFVDVIGAYDAYEAIIDGAEGYLLVTQNAPLSFGMVEGNLQVIGLYDDGKPVYADVDAEPADLIGETIEYIGGELVYDGMSVECADDIFVVIIDEDGEAVILESVEELNDYVETLNGFAHGSGADDCYAYVFEAAWFYGDPVDELYVDLTVTD